MKKRGKPETSQQPPTIWSLYYLHAQVAQVGANPDRAVPGFNNFFQVVQVVRGVDNRRLAAGMYGDELNASFHGESLLVV